MADTDKTTSDNSLVRVRRFSSPEYSVKYIKTKEPTDSGRPYVDVYEEPPKEDQIENWLKNNTVTRINDPFPEIIYSHRGYLLMGKNGALCTIYPANHKITVPQFGTPANPLIYRWDVTIKSQPKDLPLPSELENALEEMKFTKVEMFDYKGTFRF